MLVGGQGVGKSTFWEVLASPDYFCDDFSDPADKDHKLKLHQSWIVEWGKLHGLSKKEATQVKQFMSCAKNSIRAPYARKREILTTVLELDTPQFSNQVRGRVTKILKLEGFEQTPNPVFYSFPQGQKIRPRVWDRTASSYSSEEKLTQNLTQLTQT